MFNATLPTRANLSANEDLKLLVLKLIVEEPISTVSIAISSVRKA